MFEVPAPNLKSGQLLNYELNMNLLCTVYDDMSYERFAKGGERYGNGPVVFHPFLWPLACHLRAIQAMTTGSSLVTWRLSQLHVHSKEDIEVKTVQPFSMYFGAVLNLYHVDAFHVKTGSDKLTLGSLKRWCRNRFWVELFLLECGGQNPPPLQCYQGGKRT